MFCFGSRNKKSQRDFEQESYMKVLERLRKKDYLKPDNFLYSMFNKSDSGKFLIRPEELIKEEIDLLSFISVSCFEFSFHEHMDRDEPLSNYRVVKCVGIPVFPLIPVTAWDESYFKLSKTKQKELLFKHEILEINVQFVISDKSYIWFQQAVYDEVAEQEPGYFLSVGLDKSEFKRVWALRYSAYATVNTSLEGGIFKEPDSLQSHIGTKDYIDLYGVLNDNVTSDSCNKSVKLEHGELTTSIYQEEAAYYDALDSLFMDKIVARY